MKPVSAWNSTPYTPLDRPERAQNPYICRIAPAMTALTFDFIDNGAPKKATHTIYYRVRGNEPQTPETAWTALPVEDADCGQICNLKPKTDYEFYVERDTDGAKSEIRLARTGAVCGRVVNYLHPEDPAYAFSGQYLCSPSLCRLPSGRLLSSMDVFRGGAPQNLTILFYSDDDGDSWHYLTELFPCFWGQLFVAGSSGRLYMLAVSNEYGDLLIGASDNEGRDWTMPTVLFRGAASPHERGLHRAPMRLLESHGRLWTDVEYGAWEKHEMNNAVLSAPADADDYTDPAVWTLSAFWRHADFAKHALSDQIVDGCIGGIEGNIVAAPDGTLYDFLRYAHRKCLLLKLDPDNPEAMPVYDRLVDADITPSKFDIVWDDVSGMYYMLASRALDAPKTNRNLLSLFRSRDLLSWELVTDVLDAKALDPSVVGFQYVSFLIDGDDILFLCRTAYGKPANFHDANYQTFHRIRDFRSL